MPLLGAKPPERRCPERLAQLGERGRIRGLISAAKKRRRRTFLLRFTLRAKGRQESLEVRLKSRKHSGKETVKTENERRWDFFTMGKVTKKNSLIR